MKITKKFNLISKIYAYFLRKALFFNRDKFYSQGMPSYVGLINEYISIDIMVEGIYDIKSIHEVIELGQSDLISFNFDTFIDIGANIGNHTVYLSKYFKNVIAFEPNPYTFKLLELNTMDLLNVEIHNFGLSSTDKSIYLSEDSRNLGGSAVFENKEDIPSDLTVRNINLKQLDKFPLNIETGASILIKLDVEGHELETLMGSQIFLKKNKPIIFFEQHEYDFVNSKSQTINFLSDKGYEFYLFKSVYDCYRLSFIKIILKSLFGDIHELIKLKSVPPAFYDSIIAIHNESIKL